MIDFDNERSTFGASGGIVLDNSKIENFSFESRKAIRDQLGSYTSNLLVIVHHSSDYSEYGEDYARRDFERCMWRVSLRSWRSKFVEIAGAHDTLYIVVKLSSGNRYLAAYERCLELLETLDATEPSDIFLNITPEDTSHPEWDPYWREQLGNIDLEQLRMVYTMNSLALNFDKSYNKFPKIAGCSTAYLYTTAVDCAVSELESTDRILYERVGTIIAETQYLDEDYVALILKSVGYQLHENGEWGA